MKAISKREPTKILTTETDKKNINNETKKNEVPLNKGKNTHINKEDDNSKS